MEILKETAVNIAVCSVVSAVIYALAPESSGKKALRILLTLTLITVVVTPLINYADAKEDLFAYYSENNTQSYDSEKKRLNDNLIRYYEYTTKRIVGEVLDRLKVSDYRIKVTVEAYGEYGINISDICIYLKDEYKNMEPEILDAVKKEINIDAEIYYEHK